MTRAAQETPVAGPAAGLAAALRTALPAVETARLRPRAPRREDVDARAEVMAGPNSARLGGPFDRDAAFTDFAATAGRGPLRGHGLMTAETRGGEVAGFVPLGFEPGDLEPELDWLPRPAVRGMGLAEAAARTLRALARGRLGPPSLVSCTDPANGSSRRPALRLGARPDGMVDGAEVWRHAPPTHPPPEHAA